MLTIAAASPEQKMRARKALNHAVADGRVQPGPCERCGAARAQAHHDDYSRPLDVRWLCAPCHSKLHNQRYPLTKACQVCGTVFTPHPTKRARAKTCSPVCRSAAISRALRERPVIPPWAKLNFNAAEAIRARYAADGVTHRDLADEFNIHHSQVAAICAGKAWRAPDERACGTKRQGASA